MAELPRKVDINLAAIPVRGFGGMCMVVTSVVCAASLPQTRWFMLAALVAGIVFGGAMILLRAGKGARPSHGAPPTAAAIAALRRPLLGAICNGPARVPESDESNPVHLWPSAIQANCTHTVFTCV